MAHYNLALIGFGNVGRALARLLVRKEADLKEKYDITFTFTLVATGSHGTAISPEGLNIRKVLDVYENKGDLTDLSTVTLPENFEKMLVAAKANVLFENSPVDYETGQPAIDHIKAALGQGIHAFTANKGPIVHAHKELKALAQTNECKFFFESTVMDGAPIFSLYRETLPAANLLGLKGILNSTTNMILSMMEDGQTFDDAVAYCQKIGIAETDPSGDVDGWDAAIKLSALASVMMDYPLKPQDVDRKGIRDVTPEMIADAQAEGMRWKLVCKAYREGDLVKASVAPEIVGPDTPLFTVEGTSAIVQFQTDVLGLLTICEDDPSPDTTAYGLLADFVNATKTS